MPLEARRGSRGCTWSFSWERLSGLSLLPESPLLVGYTILCFNRTVSLDEDVQCLVKLLDSYRVGQLRAVQQRESGPTANHLLQGKGFAFPHDQQEVLYRRVRSSARNAGAGRSTFFRPCSNRFFTSSLSVPGSELSSAASFTGVAPYPTSGTLLLPWWLSTLCTMPSSRPPSHPTCGCTTGRHSTRCSQHHFPFRRSSQERSCGGQQNPSSEPQSGGCGKGS